MTSLQISMTAEDILELSEELVDARGQLLMWLQPLSGCCLEFVAVNGYCTNPGCVRFREDTVVEWARVSARLARRLMAIADQNTASEGLPVEHEVARHE